MRQPQEFAFELFDLMKPHEQIMVSELAKNKPEKFIQCGKDYIDKGGLIQFNSDYSIITKLHPIPDEIVSILPFTINQISKHQHHEKTD
jgi:hypothetical protein